ncbi:MAG: AAA family ATPase [Anaerolineae bacterium]|nr:AAA family ATPase [Anaerolineae bacterium]
MSGQEKKRPEKQIEPDFPVTDPETVVRRNRSGKGEVIDLPLLRTKYSLPPVRSNLVSRAHLLARLSAGLERKCVLVSAPAGFGKTTLVRSWLSQCDCSIAWLALDESDNDPVRFLRYVIAALQAVLPDLDKMADDQPSSATAPALNRALAVLINEIAAFGVQDTPPLVIVLDDYHTIQTAAIHDELAFLLDHLPTHMHVVLITRADPPLPLSRLRARNQLCEIRMNDLRFTSAEAAAFLNQVMGLHLAAEDVQALEARTEGWVVGLQMAALALQSVGVPSSGQGASDFVQAFAGSNRYVLDYLMEEVVERQADDVQVFLMRTAVLDRLTGSLCDALRGEFSAEQPGQEMLERLERANLFIMPLDYQKEWYRYHSLFADLLRQRLRRNEPALALELHRRASRWHAQNGLIEEAIVHALKGEDMEQAALLIEQAAEAILMRSELVTLKTWFDALPQAVVRQRPLLCLYYAGVLLLTGEPQGRVQVYLETAGYGVADAAAHGATILRALLALWQGDVTQSVRLSQHALASLPEQSLFWRGIVAGNLGIAYLYNGVEPDRAEQMLEMAADLGERAGNVMGAVIALCNLAELRVAQGQLRAAQKLYDRALTLSVDHQGQRLPIGDMAVAGAAGLLLEWDELEEAERLLVSVLDPHSETLSIWAADGYLALARLKQSQGDREAAQEAIERARAVAASTSATELDDWIVAAAQTRLWIAQGGLDAAEDWASRRGLVDTPDGGYGSALYALYELEHLALVELRLAQDKPRDALDVLAALLDRARTLKRTDAMVKTLVLMTLAYQQLKKPDQALAALEEALASAQPGGYVRTFVDRGPRMAHMLRQALVQGIAVDYVQQLLAAFGLDPVASTRRQELVEPFSERELQVLRLLAASLSSVEIAAELYVSANTVRFHLKNIYAKLNVHSREDAVQRAKELGLL